MECGQWFIWKNRPHIWNTTSSLMQSSNYMTFRVFRSLYCSHYTTSRLVSGMLKPFSSADYMTEQRQEVSHYKIFHQEECVWSPNSVLSWKHVHATILMIPWLFLCTTRRVTFAVKIKMSGHFLAWLANTFHTDIMVPLLNCNNLGESLTFPFHATTTQLSFPTHHSFWLASVLYFTLCVSVTLF